MACGEFGETVVERSDGEGLWPQPWLGNVCGLLPGVGCNGVVERVLGWIWFGKQTVLDRWREPVAGDAVGVVQVVEVSVGSARFVNLCLDRMRFLVRPEPPVGLGRLIPMEGGEGRGWL